MCSLQQVQWLIETMNSSFLPGNFSPAQLDNTVPSSTTPSIAFSLKWKLISSGKEIQKDSYQMKPLLIITKQQILITMWWEGSSRILTLKQILPFLPIRRNGNPTIPPAEGNWKQPVVSLCTPTIWFIISLIPRNQN